MYEAWFKRPLDFTLALISIIVLLPVFLILIVTGAVCMGGNPFFVQSRPGMIGRDGQEKIFNLIKFRSMNNRRDNQGNLLPDEDRLTNYGKFIRSTSLDELPELFNILRGDMALVGPRPQLVRDMVFMTEEQRKRHTVRQGLTGLAQVNGRNNTSWETKLEKDLQYIENIRFVEDVRIIFVTIWKVLKRDGVATEGMETAEDYGDYLLRVKAITKEEYDEKQKTARKLLALGKTLSTT